MQFNPNFTNNLFSLKPHWLLKNSKYVAYLKTHISPEVRKNVKNSNLPSFAHTIAEK